MARFGDYAAKCQTIRMERRDGILQMTFHTNGGSLQRGLLSHAELPQAFRIPPLLRLAWSASRSPAPV